MTIKDEATPAADPLEAMQATLGRALNSLQDQTNGRALAVVEQFAEQVEGARSRTAPVQAREERKAAPTPDTTEKGRSFGSLAYAREFRVVGDARAPLYRRMERGRSWEDIEDLRASRNPGMDDLAKEWARAVASKNVHGQHLLCERMNDEYCAAMGYGRAPLLEGAPDASSGFAVGSGADLLPLPLANQLIVERDKASKMRALVNTFPMTTQTERVPVLPTMAANTRLENAAYADGTPTADSALLSAKDLGVSFAAGRNFLEDTSFNIANQLTVVAGGAIGAEEDIQICTSTGAGSDITEGLDGGTVTDLAESVLNSILFVDLVALYYGVPEQYRRNAVWLAAGTTIVDLLGILDGSNRPVLLGGLDAPRPINDVDPDAVGMILNKPIYEVPVADDVVYFGDPMWYALGNRAGIRVDADRAVTTGLTTWVVDERIDGRLIPTSAINVNNSWRKTVY